MRGVKVARRDQVGKLGHEHWREVRIRQVVLESFYAQQLLLAPLSNPLSRLFCAVLAALSALLEHLGSQTRDVVSNRLHRLFVLSQSSHRVSDLMPQLHLCLLLHVVGSRPQDALGKIFRL